MKKNIAIVMGGHSSEYPISIKSGEVVHKYLDPKKFNAHRIVIEREEWVHLDDSGQRHPVDRADFSIAPKGEKIHFDCVFNAIHGSPGEDGILQAYFQLLGLPQTSCGSYEAALTFNKRDLLAVLRAYGVPCADSFYLNKGQAVDPAAIVKKVGMPCFVKANRAGSSFGISKVYKKEELHQAIEVALKEDDQIIIESFLDGTEVSVGVITHQGEVVVLPVTEIISENDFFDYQAKYQGKSQEVTPARISAAQHENVAKLARFIYTTLGLKGYTRSEFIFIGDRPHLLEVNTTPGLTQESLLPQQAAVAGISLEELFESAIREALR